MKTLPRLVVLLVLPTAFLQPMVHAAAPASASPAPSLPSPALLLKEVKLQADGSPEPEALRARMAAAGIASFWLGNADPAKAINEQGKLVTVRAREMEPRWASALAGAIAALLSQPSSHEKIRQGDYEARLLVNPAPSYSNAGQAASMGSPYPVLWLKSNTGEADLIYIYESPPGPGMVDWPKLYTAREYLEGRRETVSILGTV